MEPKIEMENLALVSVVFVADPLVNFTPGLEYEGTSLCKHLGFAIISQTKTPRKE
jgi:hypothetical protein